MPYINHVQKQHPLIASVASGMDDHTVEMCIVFSLISIPDLFVKETDAWCSGPKMKKTIQAVYSNKSKRCGLSWYEVSASGPLPKVIYTSVRQH